MDRPLIALGLQTVARQGAPHMVELGAVKVIEGEIEDTFDSLICPPVPIEPEASDWHGITEEDIRAAPHAAEVLDAFQIWAGDERLATHDAEEAATALAFEYARAELTPPGSPILDTRALAHHFMPEAEGHDLETLCAHLDLEEGEQRRGLADAVWCWKVLEECLERRGRDDDGYGECLALGHAPVTIPGQRPKSPAPTRRVRQLEEARVGAVQVQLVYGAGASPASLRVLPRFLFDRGGHSYMEAECQMSGLLKTYRIDRIQRVDSGAGAGRASGLRPGTGLQRRKSLR